jgi:hypothetical protein
VARPLPRVPAPKWDSDDSNVGPHDARWI